MTELGVGSDLAGRVCHCVSTGGLHIFYNAMIKYAILRYKCLFINEGVLMLTDNMNLFGCMFMLRVMLLRF